MVVLGAPDHTYVMRQSWNGYQPVVDADTADATWGAWWNLQKWTPRA
jgi:peptide/nickel transport system substrate-binding protein